MLSPPQTAAGLWLIDGLSPGGGREKFVLAQEWKRCAPLVCVAIECTAIRPPRSALLGPGYDLENPHCNDCTSCRLPGGREQLFLESRLSPWS